MSKREHFTNGRCFAGGTGIALIGLSFAAQIAVWPHWISIGMGYGAGAIMFLGSAALVSRSFYSSDIDAEIATDQSYLQATEEERRLCDLGRDVDGLFTSLQIESFSVAKSVAKLMRQLPQVEPPTKEEFLSDRGGVEAHLKAMSAAKRPFYEAFTKIQAEYARDIAPRVKAVALSFQANGVPNAVGRCSNYFETVYVPNDLSIVKQNLTILASNLEETIIRND